MKTQEMVLICRYAKEEICIARIVRDSFEAFLKKELGKVEKRLCAAV